MTTTSSPEPRYAAFIDRDEAKDLGIISHVTQDELRAMQHMTLHRSLIQPYGDCPDLLSPVRTTEPEAA